MRSLVAIARALADTVAPVRCVGCDDALADDEERFCGACVVLLDEPPPALRPPALAASVFAYGGPLADGIRRFKYAARGDLAAPLGALLATAASAYSGRCDRVVPVPLHRTRLVERGFNQAALIARPLSRALGVPLDVRILRRVRPTPPQAGLDAMRRVENVRGAFVARSAEALRILVVDDVRTTGSTLAECARSLRDAGASEVCTLSLAAAVGE